MVLLLVLAGLIHAVEFFSCICGQLVFDGLTYISGVRGYQGHVSFIIQQASLAHSSGGIRVTCAARRGKPQRPNTVRVSTCIIFAIIPLTKTSPESVLKETNQEHGKKKRELLQTIQCNQTLCFFLGGGMCRFDLGDKARRVKNDSKIS